MGYSLDPNTFVTIEIIIWMFLLGIAFVLRAIISGKGLGESVYHEDA